MSTRIALIVILAALSAAVAAEPMSGEREAAELEGVRQRMCPVADAPPFNYAEAFDVERQAMAPVRLFDNLYFVGMKTVSSWALTTSEGIILLDTIVHYGVKETIVAGLERLGLDPATIRYVIVAHGHNDHFGGAKYLQDTYGARVVMSAADWDHIRTSKQLGPEAPLPKRDIVASDGDEITLGDTTVRLVLTPGHTPGTLSFIFPVRDGAAVHRVGYWGGGTVSFLKEDEIDTYVNSAHRFRDMDTTIDVEMTNHPFFDGMLPKLELLAARAPGGPHPAVTGNAAFRRWMDVFADCARKTAAAKRAAPGA
jgi:metallo-beta-lactamase class B